MYNKHENTPLRGKISVTAWALDHKECSYGETSRRNRRKLCRHSDPYWDWWDSRVIGEAWTYRGPHVTKGKKPKTWKDYK